MKRAYLDANFLICLLVANHPLQAPAMTFFATLRIHNYRLYISPLGLDELWMAVYNEKLNRGLIKRGIINAHQEIENSWNTLKGYNSIKKVQIKDNLDNGVEYALDYIAKHNLRPRDAFHLAIATSNKITEFVTNDNGFTRNNVDQSGFTILTF